MTDANGRDAGAARGGLRAEVIRLADEVARRGGGPPPPLGASRTQLVRLEHVLGFRVPRELGEWLSHRNGGGAISRPLYGIDSPAWDIAEDLSFHSTWRGRKWVPVAGDGCGNVYVVDASRRHLQSDAVFFVDTIADPGTPAYVVASGVWRFLRFLLDDELRGLSDPPPEAPNRTDWRERLEAAMPAYLERHPWPFVESYVLARDPELARAPAELLPWNEESARG